tara:strand:+ start:157 stop:1338 length:1182 start_codon:yes stop_codon:yes gene_type:complete
MANIFKRFQNAINKKSDTTIQLQSSSTETLKVIGDFFSFGKGQSNADQFIKAFGENPLVYMIINKIAFTSASIDRIAFDKSGNQIENSKLLELINNPNGSQGRIELLETINQQINITGNAYIRYSKEGLYQELKVLPSNKIEVSVDSLGEVIGYVQTRIDGSELPIPADEVLHIKTSNVVNIDGTSGYYGLSPLQAAWMVVKSSEEIFSAEASIFKNRGIIGILTNETDVPMLPREREGLQQQFDSEMGGADQYNKIKISNTKLKYIQTGMSPTDLKLLDGILNKMRLLCSVFGLNSVLFNDQVSSTFNNNEQAVKSAFIDVYIPLANKIDRELSRFLSPLLGVDEFINIDIASVDVLKSINKEHTDAILAQLLAGVIDESEARDVLGYDVKN